MKKLFLPLLSIYFSFFFAANLFAASGACSGHGGVDCSAGADTDGSVICIDGWKNSSVQYNTMVKCGFSSTTVVEPVSGNIFSDVNSSTEHYLAIKYLKDNNIVSGYSDGSFKPNNLINRAEFTKILIGSAFPNQTAPSSTIGFTDVSTTHWANQYVLLAKYKKIIKGYNDGSFQPNNNISSAEALKIALETNYPGQVSAISNSQNWYDPYFDAAKEKQLILPNWTNPNHKITRAEMAELMYRMRVK